VVEQLPAWRELHYQKQLLVVLYYLSSITNLVELNDYRVPHFPQNVDLPRHALNIALLQYFVLVQNFHRHVLLSQQVNSQLHFPERSFSYRLY